MSRIQDLQENRNQLNQLAKDLMHKIDLTRGTEDEFYWSNRLSDVNRKLKNIKVELGDVQMGHYNGEDYLPWDKEDEWADED